MILKINITKLNKMSKNTLFSYYWFVDEKEEDITSIRVYGLGDNNENICLRITDFTPYVYLELPSNIEWTETKAQLLGDKLDNLMGKQKPLKKCLIWKYKLYGASLNKDGSRRKFPYLFCSFSTKNDIKKLSWDLKKRITVIGIGTITLKMHEQDADPILQFVTAKNIPTAGWITFSGDRIVSEDEKITLCDLEYKVKWKNVKRCDNKLSVGKPKIMGFDIEVNSSNPSAMPKAEKPGDKIFQISCVFSVDSSNIFISHLLSLGEPLQEAVGNDVIIHTYKTEADLLVGFTELIRKENPNVIVGYNILGFDIPYMIDRAKSSYTYSCINEFDKMGFHKYLHAKEKIIKWSSSAYKNQEFQFLDSEGRLFVDLLPLIKRDYKMDNYRLNTVSEFFLGDKKDDLSVKGIFKCYRVGTKKETDGTYSSKAKKAMGICGHYCLIDSVLVVKLMEKLQTWIGLTEMATVCNTSIFSLYTQGQQIKVYSQVYKYCYENNFVVEKDGYIASENERYIGAHVFPPVPGIYNRVLPFDFCLSGDTLVNLSNGLSKRIDNFDKDKLVLGFNKKSDGFENFSFINGLQKKGVRDTVKIYFQDGSSIIATPEHKFMLENGEWCQAKDLKNKYVKAGIKFPEDKTCDLEREWKLEVEDYVLNMKNDEERDKSLAFSRMIGYILADGSIYESTCKRGYTRKSSEVCFGTMYDALSFKRDINLFSDVDVVIRKRNGDGNVDREKKGTTLSITIPSNLSKMFHSLEDIVVGKRATQEMKLPKFVLEDNCPISIIREFLGGLFGGDGTAPCLCKDKRFGSIRFKLTSVEEYVEHLNIFMKNISKLLFKFDLETVIYKPFKIKYKENSIKPKDYILNPRYDIELQLLSNQYYSFNNLINFRYCVNKSYKLYISSLYENMANNSRMQYEYVKKNCVNLTNNGLTFEESLRNSIDMLEKKEPLLLKKSLTEIKKQNLKKNTKMRLSQYNFQYPEEFIKDLELLDMFKSNYNIIKTDDTKILSFKFLVSDVREHEPKEVFDIEIDDVHNFIANGITVSNCSLYPTTMIAYNLDYSTLVTDDSIPDSKCNIFTWKDCVSCCHDPKVIRKNELTEYIEQEKKIIKSLREKRDNKSNKKIREKIVEELNKKVEELKPYTEERSKIVKTISKYPMCEERHYRFLKEPKGVIPTILENLLNARKNTRKEIKKHKSEISETEDADTIKNLKLLNSVLDKRQLAYKISANSVASTTPIPCRIEGMFIYKTIEEISKGDWKRINEEQEVSTPIDNLEVWSDMGFTKPKFVMRHYTNEVLKRIVTDLGVVTCTTDHSLLKPNGEEVKPSDCKVGDELMHKECILQLENDYTYTFDEKNDFYNCSSEIESAKIFNLLRKHGYNVKIEYVNDEYVMKYSKSTLNISNKIKKIEDVKIPQYVYDIETENHHFAAGVGNMIVHNSMYGSWGVRKGYLPFMPGAIVTTYMGRTNIEIVAKTIQKKYNGELVYGDTDSNYIHFPHIKTAAESWDYALKVAEEVSRLFPPPINQ